MNDAQKRLSPATYRKYKYLSDSLKVYVHELGLESINQLDNERLRDFRHTWKDANRSAQKKMERLKAIIRFCLDSGWLEKDPTRGIKIGKAPDNPTLPFTAEEMDKILDAASSDPWLYAFILVLRYTGLRISDVSLLKDTHFDGARIFLRQAKTKEPIWIPIPSLVQDSLKAIKTRGGYLFLRAESTRLETVTDLWRRQLNRNFKTAGIVNGHAHRFRDTAACSWLLSGVDLETVSTLLGHTSIRITEKHYAPWIRERQVKLEETVKRTFTAPKLVRVK